MSKRPHHTARRVLALAVTSIALVTGLLLNAVSAVAQVLPPESVDPAGPDTSTPIHASGAATWPFVLLAGVVVLAAAVLTYGLIRRHRNPAARPLRDETAGPQLIDAISVP